MADELRIKVRRRGSLKSSLTSFSKFLDGLAELEREINQLEMIQLQGRLDKIEQIWNEFNEIQFEIESIVNDADVEAQFLERETFVNDFNIVTARAKLILGANGAGSEERASEDNSLSNSISVQNNSNIANVKLPVITLPNFSGNHENWLEFRDTFQSLIHENSMLTNIQKYHYLKASVDGVASQIIKSIEFSSSGYILAWEAICERFDNKRLLIHNHIKSIFSIEQIQKETAVKLRKIVDNVSKNLRFLEILEQPVDTWDTLLIFIVTSKFEIATLQEWEKYSSTLTDLPKWLDLKQFLNSRAEVLETIEHKNAEVKNSKGYKDRQAKTFLTTSNNKSNQLNYIKCNYCKGSHTIYSCDQFCKLPVCERIKYAKNARLCLNCLRLGHDYKKCSLGPCKKCKEHHNTLLHKGSDNNSTSEVFVEPQQSGSFSVVNSNNAFDTFEMGGQVLLSTARIIVIDEQGEPHSARALLDCGSQSSFITSRFASKLHLKMKETNLSLHGIGNSVSNVHKKCQIKALSKCMSYSFSLNCFVIPEITGQLPISKINCNIQIPKNIVLADPQFYIPGSIDILIGAELFWTVLCSGRIVLGKHYPIFQETLLGWVVSGPLGLQSPDHLKCHLVTNDELNNSLRKFWEIEEVADSKPMSNEELMCENHFEKTTRRDPNGRFIVSFPLKGSIDSLGESRLTAIKRFLSLEKRLRNNDILKERYIDFMNEYLLLGHMSEITETNPIHQHEYFMPHHGVLKEESTTTKLRVVFNASCPTSTGISLNDLQAVGPTLQDDLFAIVLRFRKYLCVFSADINKMYRQVFIDERQRHLQQIIWRFNYAEPLKSYILHTVTYGQASSAYLAIKCLFVLAMECESLYPKVAKAIREGFYVDDLLMGADSIEEASALAKNIFDVLLGGCFELRKWHSNEPSVLCQLDAGVVSQEPLRAIGDPKSKTLGLLWDSQLDRLFFHAIPMPELSAITKRSVLSYTSKIFDPLGLLSPFTILTKVLMQSIWLEKLSWDDPLPAHLLQRWGQIQKAMSLLEKVSVPRHVICRNATTIQLHGFSDASETAYGACVYLRSISDCGHISVNLLCGKSKVAPIKRLSIPRLELCAAHLLARLVRKVVDSTKITFECIYLWSDSTVTLAWIRTSPNLLQTFVGNRVSAIQTLMSNGKWCHISGSSNPADHVSRGLLVQDLIDCELWWLGPKFLSQEVNGWPETEVDIANIPEMRAPSRKAFVVNTDSIFTRFSSFIKLQRVVAYLLRFSHNCRHRDSKYTGDLSLNEINMAMVTLVRQAQAESFSREIKCLLDKHPLNLRSKVLSLSPFLDENNLLRVGGRLKNSDFNFDKRHPYVLCGKHLLSKLIFQNEHVRLMHCGPQQLLFRVREKFWVTSGRNLARNIVRNCIICFKCQPRGINPIMGQLPRDRLQIGYPFQVVGVDYAGPITIKDKAGRGAKCSKCYISVFVCFLTKAIHIEVVSSLSTQAFLSALRRFVSRRGRPSIIYSDNGTNFVGAYKELGQLIAKSKNEIVNSCLNEEIQWQFMPPYSPHFGGLWEAGVKSVKHHLKRIVSDVKLTFEELTTILSQIEAILNSRPLTPLSSDPNDLLPLTPAHLLISRPLIAAPDSYIQFPPVNQLNRFHLQQSIVQHFWSRWSTEYVSELQQKTRWKQTQGSLKEGDLVLLKEERTLPTDWRLGRVVAIHRGVDGEARVAMVKTRQGLLKRSFPRICPLPLEN